jgi:predicted PurR-regulated permease PerM
MIMFDVMKEKIDNSIIVQLLFIAVIMFFAYWIYKEMYFMLSAFLGAITLYILLNVPFYTLVLQKKWKKPVTAIFLIVLSIIIIILPIIWLSNYGYNLIVPFVKNPVIFTDAFEKIHAYINEKIQIDILDKSYISKLNTYLISFLQNALGNTMSVIGNITFMYLILYFMLTQSFEMEKWIRSNLPFAQENVQMFMHKTKALIFSNAISIPIVAILQGAVGLIGYWIFGVENFILFALLTAIASVIPMVGALVIYLPLMIYLMANGQVWQGIGVLLWGIIVIGSVDNIARFMLAKKMTNTHPLITIFGVIIGVNLFGFWGIIFGPLLFSVFFILIEIYNREYA